MAHQSLSLPVLYKRTAGGEVQTWKIEIEECSTDGAAVVVTTHGLEHGKKQVIRTPYTRGKNIGRANETTPLQQAVKEAQAEWKKKRDRQHYGLTVTSSEAKKVLSPMLAQTYNSPDRIPWGSGTYAQPKLDGNRCIAFCEPRSVTLYSRQGKEIQLPHIIEPLRSIMQPGDIFDGELYLHGESLNNIRSLIVRPRLESESIVYCVYDMLISTAFCQRYAVLTDRITQAEQTPKVDLVHTQPVRNETELMEFQARAIALGYEGAMLRYGIAPYEPGKRSPYLLKVKNFLEAEFPVIGVREGRGTHTGMAVFTCVHQGNPFDVTAPGTHEEKRKYWKQGAENIGRLLTVKFQYYTVTQHPVPFLPVAVGFRSGE